MQDEIQTRSYFVLQVKCPSFLTDDVQTSMLCTTSEQSVRYAISGKSLVSKRRHSREGTLFSK